jgi:toxin-antitoxin system PIN domain toxin
VILIDANLLVYASSSALPEHSRARPWLERVLNGQTRVGLAWPSLLAFLRLMTNPRVFPQPLSMRDAWGQVESWLSRDVVWIPTPTARHADILARLIAQPGVRGNLVHDADLAALAIAHGLELCSADGDFARFKDLRWFNPLAD